jgi:uncharacterized membrane-anchored protein
MIEYYAKNVYGIERYYVKDEKTAKIFQAITGRKTLEAKDLHNFKELGIEFREVLAEKKEKA